MTGTIHGAEHAPVNEAWIVATRGAQRELTLSDRTGRYELRLPDAGSWELTFEAERHAVLSRRVDVHGTVRVDADLVPLARIRGHVRARVPGLFVQACGADGAIYRGSVDASGAFGFQVEAGTYELHLVTGAFHWEPETTVRVAPGGEAVVTLALAHLGSLQGRLHLPGPEVDSIRISLTHLASGQTLRVAGGTEFQVDHLAPGGYVVEATLHPGGQRLTGCAEIVADTTSSVELGADQAVIEGFVAPPRSTAVRLHAFLDDEVVESRPLLVVQTGADGRFEFRGVEPGTYLVVGVDGEACDSRRVVVAAHTTTGVHLTLSDVTHEVRVVDGATPLAGQSVQLIRKPYLRLRRWIRTDADGVAHVRGVPPGRYLVRYGGRSALVDLAAGRSTVNFALPQ